MRKIKIPKFSYNKGWTDTGISEVLGKPESFRYSDRFFRSWYSENLIEIRGNKLIMKSKSAYKLNAEQDKYWEKRFQHYTSIYGTGIKGLEKADKLTFKDMVKKYPELKRYDKIR